MKEDLQGIAPEQNGLNHPMISDRPQDRFTRAALLRTQFGHCWIALRRRWWVLITSVLLIAGSVIFYTTITPPSYQSHAIMYLTAKLNLPGEGFYAEELTGYIATEAELIKSPTIMFRALEKVRLQFPKVMSSQPNSNSINFPFELSVRNSQKNSILALRATGASPEMTKTFLDAVMSEYLALKKDSRMRNVAEALAGITDQLKGLEKQIEIQQNRMTAFQLTNSISQLTDQGVSAGNYLAKLTENLAGLRTGYSLLESLTPAQFKGLSEGPQVAMSDSAVPGESSTSLAQAWNTMAPQSAYYQALQQLESLRAKRDEFSKVLRPSHSKMMQLNQDIAGLERLLKTLQGEGEELAEAQMANRKKSLKLQIQNLESQYRTWETNAAEAGRKLTEFDRIKQDLQRSRDLYDRLQVLRQTVDLNHNFDQEPLVPLAPSSRALPTYTKYALDAAGVFLSLLLGVGVLILLEFLDDRFTSIRELSLNLHTEVVGQIPRIRINHPRGTQRLLPASDTQFAFGESFRNIRTFLLFMCERNIPPKVILVTSAIPKEGKTTVASNLARRLALSGSRVLMVDADYRRSSQHRIFAVGLKPGFVEVLNQGVSPVLAIVPTAEPGLFILPAGDGSDRDSDIFQHARTNQLLRGLATQYDYIVIDSPPVLATDDAVCLGSMADGVLMVVRYSFTSSRMVVEALSRLRRRHATILGVVCNFAPSSTDYYSSYSCDYHINNNSTRLAEKDK